MTGGNINMRLEVKTRKGFLKQNLNGRNGQSSTVKV